MKNSKYFQLENQLFLSCYEPSIKEMCIVGCDRAACEDFDKWYIDILTRLGKNGKE